MSSTETSNRRQRERPHKTILVVEDEKLLRWSIREGLKSEYRILLAESAEEAFEVLRGVKRLDAVLVDVRLPGMNGLEFVRHVRNGSDLKVFIMTAYDHENAPRNALARSSPASPGVWSRLSNPARSIPPYCGSSRSCSSKAPTRGIARRPRTTQESPSRDLLVKTRTPCEPVPRCSL